VEASSQITLAEGVKAGVSASGVQNEYLSLNLILMKKPPHSCVRCTQLGLLMRIYVLHQRQLQEQFGIFLVRLRLRQALDSS